VAGAVALAYQRWLAAISGGMALAAAAKISGSSVISQPGNISQQRQRKWRIMA